MEKVLENNKIDLPKELLEVKTDYVYLGELLKNKNKYGLNTFNFDMLIHKYMLEIEYTIFSQKKCVLNISFVPFETVNKYLTNNNNIINFYTFKNEPLNLSNYIEIIQETTPKGFRVIANFNDYSIQNGNLFHNFGNDSHIVLFEVQYSLYDAELIFNTKLGRVIKMIESMHKENFLKSIRLELMSLRKENLYDNKIIDSISIIDELISKKISIEINTNNKV